MRRVIVSLMMDLTYEVEGDKGLEEVIDILEVMPDKLGGGGGPFCKGESHDLVSWVHDVEVVDDGLQDTGSKRYPGKAGENQRVSGGMKGLKVAPTTGGDFAFILMLDRGKGLVREYVYEASGPPEWWVELEGAEYVEVLYRRFGDTRRMYFAQPDVPPVRAKKTKPFVEEEKALVVAELDDDIGPGLPKSNPDDDSDSMWGH